MNGLFHQLSVCHIGKCVHCGIDQRYKDLDNPVLTAPSDRCMELNILADMILSAAIYLLYFIAEPVEFRDIPLSGIHSRIGGDLRLNHQTYIEQFQSKLVLIIIPSQAKRIFFRGIRADHIRSRTSTDFQHAL